MNQNDQTQVPTERRAIDSWQKSIEHDLKNLRQSFVANAQETKKIKETLSDVESTLATAATSVAALKKSITENTQMTAEIAGFLANLAVLNKLAKWISRAIAILGPLAALAVAVRSQWK